MKELHAPEILVIGGGASGMVAALAAARQGARVCILERMNRIGKKLLVTGNSRCNLTNLSMHSRYYHGADRTFIETVFQQCSLQDTLAFFQDLGLVWKADEENRVYPVSEQASSVLDLLRFALEHEKVDIRVSAQVDSLRKDQKFTAFLKNHQTITAEHVILAAGGQAMKDLGSNGSGFTLAKNLGHHVIEPYPALVKITLDSALLRGMKGERHDGLLFLTFGKQTIADCRGEMQFSEDGISGIPAMQISRFIQPFLKQGKKLHLVIDLFPDYSNDALLAELIGRYGRLSHLTIEQALLSLLKKRLIIPALKTAEIPHQLTADRVTDTQLKSLAQVLKHWCFPVTGTRAWNEAQVTAGGIDTREIDPHTLQSRRLPGLFFAGEVMDVDGDCGGYNLQWAWSTGFIAGRSAFSSLKA